MAYGKNQPADPNVRPSDPQKTLLESAQRLNILRQNRTSPFPRDIGPAYGPTAVHTTVQGVHTGFYSSGVASYIMTGPGFAAGMLDATWATVIGEEFTGIDASNAESWLGFMASTVTVQRIQLNLRKSSASTWSKGHSKHTRQEKCTEREKIYKKCLHRSFGNFATLPSPL